LTAPAGSAKIRPALADARERRLVVLMSTVRRSAALLALTTILAAGCSGRVEPAAAAGASSVDELAKQSLARLDGDMALPGLKEPVEVLRDEWGIPHIYARNTHDLFFAQGYVTAQDRLWQMEMWRRWHEGRLAEIFGPKAFDYDARTRLMMFRGPWDADEWASYHPEAEQIFTAYADGINAFIRQNAGNLPVEFKLTGVTPDPWTAKTVLLRWAQIGLSSVRGHAINEIQLAMNVAKYGAEEANRRAAPDPYEPLQVPEGLDVKPITQDVLNAARKGDDDPFEGTHLPPIEVLPAYKGLVPELKAMRVSGPWDPSEEGSNNWVMSGSRTPSGIPILSNDPHRRIEMPALRYFSHLVAPGWDVIGGSEPPFAGINAGSNEHMAWGFTFAGTDMVDLYVEELNPDNPNEVRWQNGWEPIKVIREEIRVKGEASPRTVELKFTRHGPVFYVDTANRRAYAVRSADQEHGTAAYMGSFKLAQASSCTDFFDRAMSWKVPTHNLICGDDKGNIALQVSGLTPNRDGWNGRLPVPGNGKYEWKGFRSDLPREMNPARGWIATANDNTHPKDYKGRPVFYHSTIGVETSRIARIRQLLGTGKILSVQDHERIQQDAYSLVAERDQPLFKGWKAGNADAEKARAMVESWDRILTRETTAGAIFVRWDEAVDKRVRTATGAEQHALVEAGLVKAIERLTHDFGSDWSTWRYGRVAESKLPHMFVKPFDLPPVERPGAFGTVNANGANFRRIIDLSNLDNSVWTNAPGQSGQPGSPFYANMRENLGNGQYEPLLFTRGAVEKHVKYRLNLHP
jgi:penicillin amidase